MQAQAVDSLSDKDAEQAVLGAMMTEKAVIPRVIALLGHTSDAFFTTDHQLIYSAILAVYERVSKADPLLVADELKRTNQINRTGGAGYLYELQAPIVETESTEFYADILHEKATRRQLIQAGAAIRELAQDESIEIAEVLNQSQESVFELGQNDAQRGFQPINPLVTTSIDAIEKLYHKQDRFLGVPTGFMDFDHMTSGLQPGNFIIIAARPSMGKTTLVLNMAQNIAIEQERPVAIFSLEMPAQDIVMRMLSAESRIDFGRLRTGNFSEDDWSPLATSASRLRETSILINDNRGLTVQGLRAEGRRLKGEYNDLALIIVDYLQLLRGTGRYTQREQEISEISRSLKVLAWELNVPIIACSQLSREVERRPDKQPQLSDLRESGAIEQDADIVAFLYREDYYEEEDAGDRVEAYLMIKKQRNGPTGNVVLYFTKKQMRFENARLNRNMNQQSATREASEGSRTYPILRSLKIRLHNVLSEVGEAFTLFFQTLFQIFRPPLQFDLLVKQLLLIGFNSLAVVMVSGFFTGMVLGVQGYIQLKPFAVEGSVARFVCVSIVKELGPMITAFVLAGRIGASITAELSTMKVTEQIDALEVMGTNPVKYLVVPRFLACSIMLPTLTIFSTFAGIAGGFTAVVTLFDVNGYFFLAEVQKNLFVGSVLISLIKATSFGMAIAAVGCYKGFSIPTAGGAEGVGTATTGSAVISLIAILILDFVLNHILFNILGLV